MRQSEAPAGTDTAHLYVRRKPSSGGSSSTDMVAATRFQRRWYATRVTTRRGRVVRVRIAFLNSVEGETQREEEVLPTVECVNCYGVGRPIDALSRFLTVHNGTSKTDLGLWRCCKGKRSCRWLIRQGTVPRVLVVLPVLIHTVRAQEATSSSLRRIPDGST